MPKYYIPEQNLGGSTPSNSIIEAATYAALVAAGGSAGELGLVTDTGLYYEYDAIRGWIHISSGSIFSVFALDRQALEMTSTIINGGLIDP